jgi:hypothetical protein
MPYVSKSQAAYFNIHKKELERQGVDVNEWDAASRGQHVPEHVHEHSNASYSVAHEARKKESNG